MTTLQAVLFDMDDTLIDWSQHEADWHQLRCDHLRPVVERLVELGHDLPDVSKVAEVYVRYNNEAWTASQAPDWIAPQQLRVMERTLHRLGVRLEEEDLRELQQAFAWAEIPGVQPFPDAVHVLESLRAAGVRTGLVTNASSPMWMRDRELESYGLLDYLDVRITAGDAGHLKPHPRAFEWVLEELGIEPTHAVFVGDRLHDDVVGAQRIGMRGVWVDRKNGEVNDGSVEPDATIDHLHELLMILDDWYPGWRDA